MAMLIERRYNPFRDFEDLNRSFFGDNGLAEFKTDIRDTGDAYLMECDLPGFKKEDIALSLEDDMLTIKAERTNSDAQNDGGRVIRSERFMGTCQRTFYVGEHVQREDVRAAFEDGVLKLYIPKKVEQPKVQENHYIAIE